MIILKNLIKSQHSSANFITFLWKLCQLKDENEMFNIILLKSEAFNPNRSCFSQNQGEYEKIKKLSIQTKKISIKAKKISVKS